MLNLTQDEQNSSHKNIIGIFEHDILQVVVLSAEKNQCSCITAITTVILLKIHLFTSVTV
jgi:hypothetical protein